MFGGCTGMLDEGDALLLFSDGVSQAGLGGAKLVLGSRGVSEHVSEWLQEDDMRMKDVPEKLVKLCRSISGGRNGDDTTAGLLRCRKADRLVILTGPPAKKSMDEQVVKRFLSMPGKHVVCSSTTADVVARCTGNTVKLARGIIQEGYPPEYELPGVDMTTEGAIMLSQVNNIINEPEESFADDTPVECLAMLMQEADVITFINGTAMNQAHQATLFRGMGVLPREAVLRLLEKKPTAKGKLVEMERC